MSEKGRKNITEELDSLSEDFLESVAGGLPYMDVKCPVAGCGFECNTFGEMNMHMRTAHPDQY